MSLRVYLESVGCKLNQCERDALARQFTEAGYDVVRCAEDADLCVVNTCAVTHVAARKSRQRVRALGRANPGARLVATGCYAGIGEEGLSADLVVPNDRKEALVSLVEARLDLWELDRGPAGPRADAGEGAISRTRPMVKIQDGCDNACTYCIVHVLRGKQRSQPRAEILAQVREWVRQGYHEVVLTGVHVGSYGRDSGDGLFDLVCAILADSPPERLRLSSIEPWDLTPEFYALWEDPRLCRHLHLPLQSGCDAVLSRMNRHYSAAEFARLVTQARDAIPGLAVTTDLIAGFPGETEEEHGASAAFVEGLAFARAHVFAYSERPGTPAADMPDPVDPPVRQRRARELREIARRSGEAFRRGFVGQTLAVLWEARGPDGRWSGLTDHYVRVYADSDEDLANALRLTRLTALEPGGLSGIVVRTSG
ncbi:MAG: tRNA (N(6)-L-threonylcarbamoyladenosine(37)-C(2))-methylthiotransferase MtaB [Anaerolineae bacterium]|nr:tRNA (N(6)-L-threonylcarbamoyladenosine(37)-C(2))-methylthiotransferase MtaB [Anaerolineae bacterium]